MDINTQNIEAIVRSVLDSIGGTMPQDAQCAKPVGAQVATGVFESLDDAVAAARASQKALNTIEKRELCIKAMREAGSRFAPELAQLTVDETKMGRVDDKIQKISAQALRTPGTECLKPEAVSGDHGLTLIENAPWGVIASVTPSTNPAATVINNAISMIAAGNAIVFAPHPAAKQVSQKTIALMNEAIIAAGGPSHLLTTVAQPSIENAQRLFRYPGIGLLVVTGGEAVVEAAREHTDKRLVAAGAGNPPTVVDETADIARAAKNIVYGASFDNNIICADEKEIVAVSSICDQLKAEMKKNNAVELTMEQAKQLESVLLTKVDANGKGEVSRDWVGRDATKIAAAIGLNVPATTRLLFVETPANHPFAVTELMMPVIPVIRAANVYEAIDLAVKLEGGNLHTASMHSNNVENLSLMANRINTSIFVKNGPCIAGLGFGGEGWTTMTISTPTGEGVTNARSFARLRRCVMVDAFRIV